MPPKKTKKGVKKNTVSGPKAKKTPKTGVKKKRTGRPPMKIDKEVVRKLASIQCTLREIAAFVGCDEKTIRNKFSDLIATTRDMGKVSLRRKQYEKAMEGNVTMLIWLGKNELGQQDRQDYVHTGNITVEITKH